MDILCGPVRRLLTSTLLIVGVIGASAPALAQRTHVAAELERDPVYVASDAEDVDRAALARAVADAAGAGVDLRVAVLPSGQAEALANELLAALPGATVAVFTASSYGVASDEIAQGRLDGALQDAADELSGPDAAAGLAAFVDALDGGGGIPIGLVVAAVIAVLLATAIVGRIWEARTRARRQARRRDRRRDQLTERVTGIGHRVVEIADRVELAGSPEASQAFAEAVVIFDEADRRLAAATTMKELDAVAADVDRADQLLDRAAVAARQARGSE